MLATTSLGGDLARYHECKKEGRNNPHLASSRRNDPTCLNFSDSLVGVLRGFVNYLEGVWRVSVGCLNGVWNLFQGCQEDIYWMSEW